MRVAAVQFGAGDDAAANLRNASAAITEAARQGARLVVLPEKWYALGEASVLARHVAAPDGPVVEQLGALAARLGIDLVAGTLSERGDGGDPRLFNTALLIGPDGAVSARYRKLHQFDADIDGRRYRESDAEQPGAGPVAARLGADPDWLCGLAICFDLRFPALFGALAAAGTDVIALPAAFTAATTEAHWEPLLRARAIELGVYVVAANQSGTHPSGFSSGGRSMIIDPWGRILAQAPADGDAVIVADLGADAVASAREALPMLELARPAAYRAPVTNGLAIGEAGSGRSA